MARVLVVEDDPDILTLIGIQLRQAGHEVVATNTAEDALAIVSATAPDVAVLDVGLPDISGLDLARSLRAQWPSLPIVFVSARVSSDDVIAGEAIGARYITKPWDHDVLLEAVAAAERSLSEHG